ncbi:hypothetical protein H6P81_017914 [Aristolochia fimbriata]|uniref:Uncharacterized protein n=1 Tax=Aristolochia fimbriata TaxID=158543 RepID=A0AAV7E1J5_ARIFI|nr:hypothetical protein H6P81_017914 [Aristolochia fimbriata]
MISPKKLVEMVCRWQERAVTEGKADVVPDHLKGHFVVYSVDGQRFVVPLKFLGRPLCRQLLRMSEDEFGLRNNSPIVLPCEAVFMDYVLSLFRRRVPSDVERALLLCLSTGQYCMFTSSLVSMNDPYSTYMCHQISLHGF